jgi:hypothetical protein
MLGRTICIGLTAAAKSGSVLAKQEKVLSSTQLQPYIHDHQQLFNKKIDLVMLL